MSQPPANPVQQRFQKLEDFWNDFAQHPDARILRWIADRDTARMLDLFVELQNEEVSSIPDLFVRMEVPFDDAGSYAASLIRSLVEQFEAVRESLRDDGMNVDWSAPHRSAQHRSAPHRSAPHRSEQAGTSELIATLASFRDFYQSIMQHLAIVLVPAAISLRSAWQQWLMSLAAQPIPPGVRFFVVDDSTAPELTELAEKFPERVLSIDPELNMPAAYEELVEQAPGEGPAHDFRRLFVKLNNAAAAGDPNSAKDLAVRATAIATANQWPHLVTVAQMALGAAYFSTGDLDSTLQCYRTANAAIADSDDPAAPRLNLQTRMSEGSALIAAGRFDEAAAVYEIAAVMAEEQSDAASEMDCWRVAGWCHESCRNADRAWECGQKSLTAGQTMDDEQRRTSTLPYTGQMMLRLRKAAPFRNGHRQVREQMLTWFGDDWESMLPQKGAV
ncbi:MAG: hypothetical protein R3C19_18820 [Planctomycetaceae bacterium]